MEISIRLKTIADLINNCESMADIGTDHAYVPIYLVKNNLCKRAIACDINKGPLEKARFNVAIEGLDSKIECRLGGGLQTIKPDEVDSVVIAGMGGNLIRDIIEERLDVFKSLKYAILQPVQNPDILRKHIYDQGYEIIDEELSLDENKFYEIIKIRYSNEPKQLEDIYYEVGPKLIEKNHYLLKDFISFKIDNYRKICSYINEDTSFAKGRKKELECKVCKLEELLRCL
ncbi:MAG: class I SAM-dependent methyltransferase [Bacillota bacterium]|nr:class I SAM-dependent methyltransferase [Bacillota bacterium]